MIQEIYPEFQHWGAKGSIYHLGDFHFNDPDTKLMNPNWIAPEEQVAILKSKITKNDTLIAHGDIGDPKYLKDLTCYKVLIKGNHDAGNSEYEEYFDEIYKGALTISNKIVLSHEPIVVFPYVTTYFHPEEDDGKQPIYMLNIHGHVHNGAPVWVDEFGVRHINVAADVVNYTPVNLKNIIKSGAISDVVTIHRATIDNATKNPIKSKNNT